METDIKDPIMPTFDNSDVSVTEHTTPLPAGEGSGVGLCGIWGIRDFELCGLLLPFYSSSVGLISSICSCTILRLNTLSSIV